MAKFSFALFLATLALADARLMAEVDDDGTLFPPADRISCAARRRLNSKSAKDDSSPVAAPTDAPKSCITVTCGQTLVGARTLDGNLACTDLESGEFALKLSGPDAVLDCAGFNIFTTGNRPVDGATGVMLENGATLKNCAVSGFATGVSVGAGDNTVYKVKAFANTDGVATTGKGCNTIKSVSSVGNDDNGFVVESTGSLIFHDNKASGNMGNDGTSSGVYVSTPRDSKLEMDIEGLMVVGNRNEGFYVDDSDPENRNAGNFRGMFYGKNYLLGNGDDGLENKSGSSKIAVVGSIEANGNGEGIDARDGKILLEETSVLTACSNTIDIRNEFITDKSTTNTTCDTRQATNGAILCPGECPDIDTVTAC